MPEQLTAGIVTVRPVTNYREMGQFINVPWKIYANDPMWVPPLKLERRFHFSKYNPYFKHGQWQAWVAYRENQPVGRISAQIDSLHQEHYGHDQGHFGLFESIEDETVCNALFNYAETWLASQGVHQVYGPFNLSINQECGILVDGFDTPPVIMMPHSPPWYGTLLEQQGYQPTKDLLAYWIDIDFKMPKVMQQLIDKFSPQITLRPLSRKNLAHDMEILRDIFNDAWSENWGFIPFTQAEFEELGQTLRFLLPDEFIQIAEVNHEPAAFMVALPNINEVVKSLNGDLFPTGLFKLINALKKQKVKTGRIPLMGVRKKYHNSLLGVALACLVIDAPRKEGLARGFKAVEMSWILDDNKAMRSILENIGSKPYKRYRIYGKTL